MKYEEVYKDWSYLYEVIGFADDMTGGYEDQQDLDEMLKNPTKSQAKKCLIRQIKYWFLAGVEAESDIRSRDKKTIIDIMDSDPNVVEIADRYDIIHIQGEI